MRTKRCFTFVLTQNDWACIVNRLLEKKLFTSTFKSHSNPCTDLMDLFLYVDNNLVNWSRTSTLRIAFVTYLSKHVLCLKIFYGKKERKCTDKKKDVKYLEFSNLSMRSPTF